MANSHDAMNARLGHVEQRLGNVEGRLGRVEQRLGHVEVRLERVEGRLGHVEVRLERVEGRLGHVEVRLERVEGRVERLEGKLGQLDKNIDNLGNATRMQFERVREDIRKLGEGYESGMKAIARQIENQNKTWMAKWSIHDAVLMDYGNRITAVEESET